MTDSPAYHRILLKISGEALMGEASFGISHEVLGRIAGEIAALVRFGVEVGLVIGGGNLFRGSWLAADGGMNRVAGDQMGMLATVMNAIAMSDALARQGLDARVLSALEMPAVCDFYTRRAAHRQLSERGVAIFSAGTGNPYFTTDSAASLRAIEIDADLMIKATKVNGVYSADPVEVPDARFYEHLSYDQVLSERLAVMDATAVVLCRDNGMLLRVMNINDAGALMRVLRGEAVGTLVNCGESND